MSREKFLKQAKNFDSNYIYGEDAKKIISEIIIKTDWTPKEYMVSVTNDPKLYSSWSKHFYSQLDYKKIAQLTINKEILNSRGEMVKNPFIYFYDLDEDMLNLFFKTLHKIKLALDDFTENKRNELRKKREREALAKKYDSVIADLETLSFEHIQVLKNRRDLLWTTKENRTERKIFEHLLIHIYIILSDRNQDFRMTERIATITNNIAYLYFDKEVCFSEKVNINNFYPYPYQVGKISFELIHSKPRY